MVSVCVVLIGLGAIYVLQDLKAQKWETTEVAERLTFNDAQGGASFDERAEFFSGSVELIQGGGLFGFGPSSFKWVYPQVQEGFLSLSDHPHNVLLKYGVERGWMAALFFVSLLGALFWKINPLSRSTGMFEKFVWASILGGMAHSMVDHNLNFVTNYMILWLLLASLAAHAISKDPHNSRPNLLTSKLHILVVCMLVAALTWSSVRIVIDSIQYKNMRSTFESTMISEEDVARYQPLLPRWTLLRLDDLARREQSELADLSRLGGDANKEREAQPHRQQRISLLKKQLAYNPYDAEAYSRLGQIALDSGENKKALEYFKKAIEVQPKNTFEYYNWYAFAGELLNDESVRHELREKVAPLIEEYIPLYEQNLHYTQRDNEMQYIDGLKKILSLEGE